MKAIDGGGDILARAKIVLIFRGNGWQNGKPTVEDAKQALKAVLASPYTSYLKQYRDIRQPAIVDTITDTRDVGGLGPDPRGVIKNKQVWVLSDEDIQTAVKDAFDTHPPRDGEETLYMVIFSRDPIPVTSAHLNAMGYHDQFDHSGRKITYGVVFNQAVNTDENIWRSTGSLPAVFGHEVVEGCSDPAGTGFKTDQKGDNELADLGMVQTVPLSGFSQNVSLAAYWSELSGVSVVPTAYSVRIALGLHHSKSEFLSGAQHRGQLLRNTILAMFRQ